MKPSVLVLTGDGVNCEKETARAFEMCGATSVIHHINDLEEKPELLKDFQILALPGGFSFGDELGSGKVFSLKLKTYLKETLKEFIDNGKPVIGICNGFQVLTKLGVLSSVPGATGLARNSEGQFIDQWSELLVHDSHCIWLKDLKSLKLPIRHGEGRFVFHPEKEDELYETFKKNKQIGLTYKENPNGSFGDIAGVCDETGLVFGLMPHPEAAVSSDLYPGRRLVGQLGLSLFQNAVKYVLEK